MHAIHNFIQKIHFEIWEKKYTENEIAKRYMDEEKYYKIREQTYYMSHRTYSSNHNYILDMTF